MPSANISEAIAMVSERLTPTERRIAQAIVDDLTLLAFGSVSDLANSIGTSRPSIVRFATKLGFADYSALQNTVREGLSQQLSRPSDRFRSDQTTQSDDLQTMTHALEQVSSLVSGNQLARIAPLLAKANAVWIVSGETSRAAAHALRSGLGIIRPNVHLLEDHSIGRELASTGPQDVAVITDFFRYRRSSVIAAQALATQKVPIVAITDGPLSPLAAFAEILIELSVPAIGPFDSSIPAIAVTELIIAEVARLDRTAAQKRIDCTEELWRETATFID